MPLKKLYFAYGSNMSQARLEARIGKVIKLGTAFIKGYQLVFGAGYDYECPEFPGGSFANLIKTGNSANTVAGVVYELSDHQFRKLDLYEGAPLYYNRVIEKFKVDKKTRQAIIYISINQSYRTLTVPSAEYMGHLLTGAKENGLKDLYAYLSNLEKLYTQARKIATDVEEVNIHNRRKGIL